MILDANLGLLFGLFRYAKVYSNVFHKNLEIFNFQVDFTMQFAYLMKKRVQIPDREQCLAGSLTGAVAS